MTTLRAIPTRDRASVLLVKGAWRSTIPVAALPGYIRLYTELRDRKAPRDAKGRVTEPGPYHGFYADDLDALKAAKAKLQEAKP